MTISRATQGKVNWSSPLFGMENQKKQKPALAPLQQQSSDCWGFVEGVKKVPNMSDHLDDRSDPFAGLRRSHPRNSDYPKATFRTPSDSAAEFGLGPSTQPEQQRDRNYFSDNFLDIPNPTPTRSGCSGHFNFNNVISESDSFRSSLLSSASGSASDNEAFSDEGSEPLKIGDYSNSKGVTSEEEVVETDQDIRRLTLASDSINPSHTSEQDFDSLLSNIERLRESGWFYENITRHQAKTLLRSKSMGAFIIRESTDPKHLFSLSVRTQRGTTSARIEYTNGRFRLDCEDSIRHHMPVFSCVVKLVNFYIKMGRKGNKPNPCVWLESTGRRDMPVRLSQPVRKEMPSLRHLCRLTIANAVTEAQDSLFPNQEAKMIAKLPLPNRLIQYVQSYPYAH